ncbi:terpene synthase family protein [Colletotrichum tabaci]|uniref:Terpene synthase family protein n=1 Tax=Colletotrichum tabaci TaxID=1209068 RepID=A0AAV9TQ73_9PEZI
MPVTVNLQLANGINLPEAMASAEMQKPEIKESLVLFLTNVNVNRVLDAVVDRLDHGIVPGNEASEPASALFSWI